MCLFRKNHGAGLQIPEWLRVRLYGLTRSVYAVPVLDKVFHYEDPASRQAAAWALGEMGDAAAVSALLVALRDGDSGVRQAAAEALGKIGHAAVVSALLTAMRDEAAGVRWAAAKALGKTGDAAAVSLVGWAACLPTLAFAQTTGVGRQTAHPTTTTP